MAQRLGWQVSPLVYTFPARSRSDLPPAGPGGLPAYLRAGLSDAALAGFDGVELPLTALRGPDRAVGLAAALRECSLAPAGVLAQLGDTSDDALATLETGLANAAAAGVADAVVVVRDGAASPADLPGLLARIAAPAAARATAVHWHPHGAELAEPRLLTEVAEALPAGSGICLDIGWVLREGLDPAELVRRLGERLTYLHVRDLLPDGTWTEAIGSGRLVQAGLPALLAAGGFDGWVVAEAKYDRRTPISGDVRDHACWSAAELRRWFSEGA